MPLTADLTNLNGAALAGLVRVLPPDELWPVVGPHLAVRPGLDLRLAAAVAARLETAAKEIRDRWLRSDSIWRQSLVGRWVLAEGWSADATRQAEALTLWTELVEQAGDNAADALLARARVRRSLGQAEAAIADLVDVARRSREGAMWVKAGRLLDRICAQGHPAAGRAGKIALLSSSTTDLFLSPLRLLCAREGLRAEIYQAPYGAYRQEILDAGSGLYAFKPEFVILALHWRDLPFKPVGNDPAAAEMAAAEFRQWWSLLQERSAATILQHTIDLPPHDSAGYLAGTDRGGRRRLLREVNRVMVETAPPGVVLVDCERLAAEAGWTVWHDDALWHVAKQHPAAPAMPRLLEEYVRLISARLGKSKKVLVLDLDNTLWGGVVGEDGVHGIKIGPPTAVGEAHAALQRYALELKQRGVLLAVCSKNNEADARQPFGANPGMVLKEDDFAAFVANWDEKPVNLRRMAAMLNLGLDSFVLVDDSPLERAKVRRELPEVSVVDLPVDVAGFVAALDRGHYFESLQLTVEDKERSTSYQANLKRSELKTAAGDLESFLRLLDMSMQHGAVDEANLDRVVQLLNKTNQFNLTTRRHGLGEVKALAQDPKGWTQYFRLVDCYGDNGIIGVVIAVPTPDEAPTWEIDTFLMSCRVLGRQAEDYMLVALVAAAQARGIRRIRGRFRPTAKNAQVKDLLPRWGFALERAMPDGETTYLWEVAKQETPKMEYIHRKED